MLHILNTSDDILLECCLATFSVGDEVVLLLRALKAVIENRNFAERLLAATEKKSCSTHGLREDWLALGSAAVDSRISLIVYAEFVELAVKHSSSQSWS